MNYVIIIGIIIAGIIGAIAVFAALPADTLQEHETEMIGVAPSEDTKVTTQGSGLCSGDALCFSGIVTEVIDGDTIKVDGQSIRFALVDAPPIKYDGGKSRSFVEQVCPVGSTAIVDQDDDQLEDKYGRMLGVIYCDDLNVNQELLDSGLGDLYSAFCDQSEFSTHSWAVKHGCESEK
ncbi:MAG: thermonuclease family protein [Nitrosopumilus sp.]|nr:thermonuclease family protein [Nitrosopumilus sp.]NNL59224.1 thermonuclease family protein [Nitrosopumilus sp.]